MHRSWYSVSSQLDVADQMVIERWVGERKDRFWNILTRCFDWNVVVVGEVDAGMTLTGVACDTKELALCFEVLRAWNMLSVTPLPISTASGRCTTTTGVAAATLATVGLSRWIAVRVGVERTGTGLACPAVADRSGTVAAGFEIRSTGPIVTIAVDSTSGGQP